MSTTPDAARNALVSMLADGFVVETAAPSIQDSLFPEEIAYLARSVQSRQAEFGTARVCARKALSELGGPSCALVPHADRAPRWPEGFIGSITHTKDCCAVVVTHLHRVAGLGTDIEPDVPLPAELERHICTEDERNWFALHDGSDRGWLGKLLFSAKEAVYKCQYRLTGTFIDYTEITLALDLARGTFTVAELHLDLGPWRPRIFRIDGKFRRQSNLIVTTAILD